MPGVVKRIFVKAVHLIREVYLLPVHCYRWIISPGMPNVCKYTPSCSVYFTNAVRKKGIVVGTIKGLWRVLRCNPWSGGGCDPVE